MDNVKAIQSTINLRVTNNTALNQNVNMLGGTSDPFAISPHLLYQWDLSSENYFGNITATIVISSTANPTPITYTVPVDGFNIQALAFALNALNLGIFQVSGNIIYVSNDFYIYGNLTVLSTAFVSTWDTTNTTGSSSASNQIQLPLDSTGVYDFIVYWGDGTQDTITSWNQVETLHNYSSAGTYTIGIVGTITEWSFGNAIVNDSEKILSISSWGTLQFGVSADVNFFNCINLDLSGVTDVPDFSASSFLANAFDGCSSLTVINKSNEWNTSTITNMIATFADCVNLNTNISNWDVSNCTDMNAMFFNCQSFNSNISGWNTALNTDMFQMFINCQSFNQPIGSWNVSSVTSMRQTFLGADAFNQTLNSWDVSSVNNMEAMFSGAISFNQNLNSWNTGLVSDMSNMFLGATAFNQPIGSWNVASVTDMAGMFASATAFDQNIGSWDVSGVLSLSGFMQNKTLLNYSTANLNAIYNGWSLLAVQPNLLNVNFNTIKYTLAGQAGRNILTGAPNNWVIIDGGI
jgi:surface protein